MPSGLQPALRSIVALLAQSGEQVDHRARTAHCDSWLCRIQEVRSSRAREDHQSLMERAAGPTFSATGERIKQGFGALGREKAVREVCIFKGLLWQDQETCVS